MSEQQESEGEPRRTRGPDRNTVGRRPFGQERRAAFLECLARTGSQAKACVAGECSMETVRVTRKSDPEFAAAWNEAMEQYRGVIETEIHRRAIEGVEKPIYQQGVRVDQHDVREYSDQLLSLHARRHIPDYREKIQVDAQHSGTLHVGLEALEGLPRELRDRLKGILLEARAPSSGGLPSRN